MNNSDKPKDNKIYLIRTGQGSEHKFDFVESGGRLRIICHGPNSYEEGRVTIDDVSQDSEGLFYVLSAIEGHETDGWGYHRQTLNIGSPSELEAVVNPRFNRKLDEPEGFKINFEYRGQEGEIIYTQTDEETFCEVTHPFPGEKRRLERYDRVSLS